MLLHWGHGTSSGVGSAARLPRRPSAGAVLLRTESASSSQIEGLTVGARQLALAELAWTVLPLLIGQPIVDAAHLRRVLGVPAMTAQSALAQLTAAGVLQEATGRSRNRVWQHTGILRLLDAFAAQVRRAR